MEIATYAILTTATYYGLYRLLVLASEHGGF